MNVFLKWLIVFGLSLCATISFANTFFFNQSYNAITVNCNKPVFQLNLPANPTTGYTWVLGTHDPLIQPITSTYTPNPNKSLIGAPGSMNWQFKVLDAACQGSHTLKLQLMYTRTWSHDTATWHSFLVVTKP